MKGRVKISKLMSYILRHNPMEMRIGRDGYAKVDDLLSLMQKKYPWLDKSTLEEIAQKDKKGRFELKGNMIRARYGHSIDVSIDFSTTDLDILYHGTTEHSAKGILKEGLKPMKRRKVHLSKTIEDAIEVGRRKTKKPIILQIDAGKALREGIRVEKATDKIYVSEHIPEKFISVYEFKIEGFRN